MFSELMVKINIRKNNLDEIERLTVECNEAVAKLNKLNDELEIDELAIRKYNLAVYAQETFKQCKGMSLEEAFKYTDDLFKKEEELENENN